MAEIAAAAGAGTAPRTAPGVRPIRRLSGAMLRPLSRGLTQLGEIVELFCVLVVSVVRQPVGFWNETRQQAFETLRLCWIPMCVSTTAFGFAAPGLQGGNIYILFGIPERLGSFFLMASVREFAPWINAMVVAGVMGTAITADLGARRIREEFDAMEVLGVDPIREVILPRVVALTVMTGLLDIVALVFGVFGGWFASLELGAHSSTFFGNFWANATTTDIAGSVLKTTIFGFFIGIVCCYKGYRAEGGPIGVGRAVNQAVVIAFIAIYVFNTMFTQLMLGLNPDMLIFR